MWTFFASKPVLSLLVAAFLLRIGAALAVQHWLDHHWQREYVIEGDAEGYWMLGQSLAQGEPYAAYDPPRYVLRMPGFPLLLALPIRLTGGSFLVTRCVLAAVGTAACGLTYLFGRELLSHRAGLWAGWYTAVSPAMVGFSVIILSETPFALGILASLWAMARLLKSLSAGRPQRVVLGWALLTGAGVALATYMRPSWLPVAGLFPMGLVLREGFRPKVLFAGGVILTTVILTLVPWAIRNHRVTGHWVVTTLWSGPSLYDGLNPEADGSSNMEFLGREDLASRMTEYELNRHYWRKAVAYARNNPGRAVELAFLKLWRYWKPWPSAEEAGNWASRSVIAFFSLVLFTGALVGVWCHRRNVMLLALTVGPVLFFAAIHAVFVGSMRYRLPTEYPLAVIAAAGWLTMIPNRFTSCPSRGKSA